MPIWVEDLSTGVLVVSVDPVTGKEGDLIYNTTDSALKIWVSGVWVTLYSTSTSSLLLEDSYELEIE